jgi:DNA-binding response OmpR family regulator
MFPPFFFSPCTKAAVSHSNPDETFIDSMIVKHNISNLHHKLEKDASQPCYIVTESKVGYRIKGQS